MKVIHCLIAAIAFCALGSGANAGEPQSGIKMLMAAAAASRHHGSVSGSASQPVGGDSQGGIKKLIAAATASRHLRPTGNGARSFRDAASNGEIEDPAGILAPGLGSRADAARSDPAHNAPSGAGSAPPAGAAANGTVAGVSQPTGQGMAHKGASGFATAPASTSLPSRPQGLSPVVMRALTPAETLLLRASRSIPAAGTCGPCSRKQEPAGSTCR